MEEDNTVVSTYVFRGIEYIVTMNIQNNGNNLLVEVEDRLTADQWRGSFDVAYIEDLTHKTGNFKQFPIFVNMLESAIIQSSDSVTLDLLTYGDLESLRNRKAGTGRPNIPGAKNSGAVNTKRYLILTYTVEFDRIHYPLPLPFMGKPDPRALQETIRQLRQENSRLQQIGNKDNKSKEYDKLKKEFDKLLQEKEGLEVKFVDYKREVQNTKEGSAAKEIRILKNVVQNLEEELTKEKNKYQKQSFRRNQELRQLSDEVDELRASERNLKVRVKSLTNEIAIYKRRGRPMNGTSPRDSFGRSSFSRERPSSSRENSFGRDSSRLSQRSYSSRTSRDRSLTKDQDRPFMNRERSLSKERSRLSADRSRLSDRSQRSQTRDRSSSRDRVPIRDRSSSSKAGSYTRERSASRERLYNNNSGLSARGRSTERTLVGTRSRTPSPFASQYSKFDPTAYINEKNRKKKEAELKKRRQVKSQLNGSAERRPRSSPAAPDRSAGRTRVRTSSFGSLRSRTSSIESLSDIGIASDASDGRRIRNGKFKTGKTTSSNVPSSPEISFSKPPSSKADKILASTPEQMPRTRRQRGGEKENRNPHHDASDNEYFNRSAEISEIDARLNRLQEFMKSNLS